MSLMEHARDLVKGPAVPAPEVGEHDTTKEPAAPARRIDGERDLVGQVLAGEPSEEAIEQARLDWETQPGHH